MFMQKLKVYAWNIYYVSHKHKTTGSRAALTILQMSIWLFGYWLKMRVSGQTYCNIKSSKIHWKWLDYIKVFNACMMHPARRGVCKVTSPLWGGGKHTLMGVDKTLIERTNYSSLSDVWPTFQISGTSDKKLRSLSWTVGLGISDRRTDRQTERQTDRQIHTPLTSPFPIRQCTHTDKHTLKWFLPREAQLC